MKIPLAIPTNHLPAFSQIRPEEIEPALDQILTENRARIAALLAEPKLYTWENLLQPLEDLDNRLEKFWSPISHLHAVAQTPALRKVYNHCLPKLTAYNTELEQNETLYQAFLALHEGPTFPQLNSAQQMVINNALRDFRLAGVALPAAQKQRYAEIEERLAKLSTLFEENLLDATEGWSKHITDETELSGIPAHVLALARATAKKKNLPGWLFTLEFPSYHPVLSYANNRALRQEMYNAYVTRASDQGPQAGRFDNSAVMTETLQLRNELSQLLGMENYAELSLASKMVKKPDEVLDFLQNLRQRVTVKAQQEMQELTAFAVKEAVKQESIDAVKNQDTQAAISSQHASDTTLQAWDMAYYSEKLREQRYGINDEMLRPYFPIERVLTGMFEVVKRLYGMTVSENQGIDVWHPDVRFFTIYDTREQTKEPTLRGQFYLDLYARPQKRGGAWMDECQSRLRLTNNEVQIPVAYLTCNLTPPEGERPALLTLDEVTTLFHEFGHGLHHMLTQVDYLSVSGINDVAWDAVELPSQFMESFVWEREVIDLISSHYQTAAPLPEELFQKLWAAKNFHAGLSLARQLEFALFDMRLHLTQSSPLSAQQIQRILDEIRASTSVFPIPAFNRFQHSFSHIFAGSYDAGYYSYLWAEVLACDAFAKFQEEGIFNGKIGQQFLQTILEQGGTAEPLALFIAFRGRPPIIEPLLKQYEIAN